MNVGSESDALTAAASDDWAARAAAGQWLAINAVPQYQAQLLALLTDSDNTAVSMNTACALLDHPSEFSVSMVMRALASTDAAGDEETLEHLLFAATPYLFQSSPPIALREALDICLLTTDHEVTTGPFWRWTTPSTSSNRGGCLTVVGYGWARTRRRRWLADRCG